MFNLLRAIEQWLQQHIFKVGWLLTKNFQTTTILYYTFFLPGIVLYEVAYWLMAGVLNVRAEQAVRWPEKQEIGELRLNFVKLSKKASPWRVAIINSAPLLAGLFVIWFIATNILSVGDVLNTLEEGTVESIGEAFRQLFTTPDFWLWAYILFTVSNTMLPDVSVFKSWRWLLLALIAATVPLFFLGVGEEVVGQALTGPISGVLNALSLIFGVMIFLDGIALAILGGIESLIERITGDSATFTDGKMIVMTRKEAMALRRQQRSRQSKQREKRPTLPAGPPSVYALEFPIPGSPGKDEPVTSIATIITSDPEAQSERPRRVEPDVISSTATRTTSKPEESDETEGEEEIGQLSYEEADDSA